MLNYIIYNYYNIILILSCIYSTKSEPIVSTSIVKMQVGLDGAIVGYSDLNNKLFIIGGEYWLTGASTPSRSNFIQTQSLTTDYILYDESHSPVDENTARLAFDYHVDIPPNIISDKSDGYSLTTALSCDKQCATQIGNLLYIVNPMGNSGVFPSEMLAIFNVDTLQYTDQNTYEYNIPNGHDYWDEDTGCVVNDGINIYVIGNHPSQPQNTDYTQFPCPDGDAIQCPITDLYKYDTITGSWTQRDELQQPNIYWRFQTGCATSPNNEYIYIFGGVKRYLMNQNYDASIRETERYHIASNTWTILPSNANLPQARWAIFSFVSLTENIIYLYGGFRIDSTVNYPSQLLDSKVMVVFDVATESIDLNNIPIWNIGQFQGLSNTIAVNNVCPYEIGIAVGSQDFANNYKQLEDVIQLLRFMNTYSDNEIIVNPITDMTQIFDAYQEHNFKFEIIVTNGALFIPDTNIDNWDFLITSWRGITTDIAATDAKFAKNNNGEEPIVTITQVTTLDVALFDRCYSSTNIIQRIEIDINIRARGRTNLCVTTKANRLKRWFFRDSDPERDGTYEKQSSVQLEIINPNNAGESIISQSWKLIHDCTV
eukprot:97823_1